MNKNSQECGDVKDAMAAIVWLAERCDWAQTNDGQGFSGVDAPLGHALANKTIWSPRETSAALGLIVKYKKQIVSGGMSMDGLEFLRERFKEQGRGEKRLRKRDLVSGNICVESNLIVLRTGYNNDLVAEIRGLVGAQWNGTVWKCVLCSENAGEVEDIALRYGLALDKHSGWDALTSLRNVEASNTQLIIRGVNARSIIKDIPKLIGSPDRDEEEFGAISAIDATSIAIPLRSWIIRDARLWLETLEESAPNYRRLSWAMDGISRILAAAYPRAIEIERQQFARAAAVSVASVAESHIRNSLPAHVTERLMPHQWVAIEALVAYPQAILADQQGLGKTIEILAALESTGAFPAIIIVPAMAVLNWRDEVTKWLPHRKVAALGSGIGKRDQGVPIDSADITIINFESFSKQSQILASLSPKALVADEAQYLKGHDSARTKAVRQFCRDTKVERIIAATGTPVMNRPSELLTLLTLLPDLLNELGGYARFASRYCRATRHSTRWTDYWDYSGAANLGELANRLRETGRFVRRDKASVLPDLRVKQINELAVEIGNRIDYALAAADFSAWLKTHNMHSGSGRRKDSTEDDTSTLVAAAEGLGWDEEAARDLSLTNDDRAEAMRRMVGLRQLV